MLGNFSLFCRLLIFFSKLTFSKISFGNTIGENVGPDMNPNCLLRSGLYLRVCNRKITFFFSTETHVVGTQKNRLNETVLLTTQNIC